MKLNPKLPRGTRYTMTCDEPIEVVGYVFNTDHKPEMVMCRDGSQVKIEDTKPCKGIWWVEDVQT